jgi:hypothetical protein
MLAQSNTYLIMPIYFFLENVSSQLNKSRVKSKKSQSLPLARLWNKPAADSQRLK